MVSGKIKYFFSRVSFYVLTIFATITIVFIVPRLIPGDPILQTLNRLEVSGAISGSSEIVNEYKRLFGLDKDILTQYVLYISQLLRGNLGISLAYFPTPVMEIIARALPWTIWLLGLSTILSWILGTVIGAIVGWKGAGKLRYELLATSTFLLYITPYYATAILMLYLFGYLIPVFELGRTGGPGSFFSTSLGDLISYTSLPALTVVLTNLGWWLLSMRSLISTVKKEDFIFFAEAEGLKSGTIMWRYAFRNAILPQVTGLTLALGRITAGALITEIIFAYPGMGWLLYDAIRSLDYTLIQGIVLIIILSVATANLLIDLIYPLLDPRIARG